MHPRARLLIVEDEAVIRAFIGRIFSRLNYEIVHASSGEDALQILAQDHDFDLILLDIVLPGIDGFEVLRQIRADPACRHMKVIVLTALTQVQDKERAFSGGADDYVSKPFEPGELVARAETQIRLKRAEDVLRRYEFIANTSAEFMTLINCEGVYEAANDAYCRAIGKPRAEIIGKTVGEIWGEEVYRNVIAPRLQTCLSGEAVHYEDSFEFSPGKTGFYRVSFYPYRSVPSGAVTHAVVVTFDITDLKQAERNLLRSTSRLRSLHEIDQAILSAQSPEELAGAALNQMQRLVPLTVSSIILMDVESSEAWLLAQLNCEGIIRDRHQPKLVYDMHNLLSVQRQKAYVVDDLERKEGRNPHETDLLEHGIRSYLSLPLVVHGEFIGVFNLGSDKTHAYTAEDIEIGQEVADILAVGIQNSRLYNLSLENLEREERLKEVTRIISGTLDVDNILKSVMRLTAELLGADAGRITLLAPDHRSVASTSQFNLPSDEDLDIPSRETGLTAAALKYGEPVVSNDYSRQPGAIRGLVEEGVRGMIGIPLTAGGKTFGILTLYRKGQARHFTRRDLALAESVGRQAGIAIQNALNFQSERRRVRELEALRESLADTLAELDLTRALEGIVLRAMNLLDGSGGELSLYDKDRNELEIVVSIGLEKNYVGTRQALGEGIMGQVAVSLQPLIVDDYRSWNDKSPQYLTLDVTTTLAVPLVAKGKLLGVLSVGDKKPEHRYNAEDLRLLHLFGQQASIGIENAMLFEAAQRRATEAETLQQAGAVVAAKLQLSETLDAIFDQVRLVVPHDSASIQLLDENTLEMEVIGGTGIIVREAAIGQRFSVMSNTPNAEVYERRRPVIVEDIQAAYPEMFTQIGQYVRGWLGAPLIVQERVIGMITLDSKQANFFTDEHARLVTALADHVAIAVENARLYEETQRRAIEAETLRQASMAVTATLDQEITINAILDQLRRVVPYDSAGVMLVRGDAMEVVGGRPYPGAPSMVGTRFPISEVTPNGIIYETHQPLVLSDCRKKYRSDFRPPFDYVESWLGVPLIIQDKVIGMLSFDSTRKNFYTTEHARLASAFANQVAIALEHARLFEEVQRLAITDGLTGLFNRRHLFTLGRSEFERAVRYARPLSVIMLDIDHFKNVNDSFGHAIGDQVLQVISDRCRDGLREVDIIGRYGGEEFIVLLPETDLKEGREVAERIRLRICQKPVETRLGSVSVTVSLGVTEVNKDETIDLDQFFDRADQALYAAKAAGRNRVAVWKQ